MNELTNDSRQNDNIVLEMDLGNPQIPIAWPNANNMERNLTKIICCLSTIRGVKEIEKYDGYFLFCYRKAYFLAFPVEGCGDLDRFIHITLIFDVNLENKHLDLARDICFKTMVEYESLRVHVNDDAHKTITIHFMADYEDKRLAKIIKRGLNDSIAAHNFFIDKLMMMDSRNFKI